MDVQSTLIRWIQYKIMKKFSPNVPQSLSQASSEWITACIDPFHDFQYDATGLPDERVAPSVVQVHTQSINLTIPASAAGGQWDASILYTGINTPIEDNCVPLGMINVPGSAIHPYNHASLSSGTRFGALTLWAGQTGFPMPTGAPTSVGDTTAQLGSVLSTDRCRLIGVAFEVNNTTAEVYKQGSLTAALLPDACEDTSLTMYTDTNASPYNYSYVQADRCCVQASTLKPLLTVPGSCTWPAAKGVYAIPRMTKVPRDIYSFKYTPGIAANQGANTRVPILYGSDGGIATPEPIGFHVDGVYEQPLFAPNAPSGFSPLQVFLTGLSAQTTLTITFRTIVEYFPALGSPLLPLADLSPVFDPKALALYSAVAREAPYAVPVEENAAGDYFRKVLKVLSRGIQLVSPMFGQYAPLVQLTGEGLGKVGHLIPKSEASPARGQGKKSKRD